MTTAINIGDQDAIIVCPQGYDASNITIVKKEDEPYQEPVKPEPQTVLEMV